MADDKTYYVQLTPNAGGGLMTVTGVDTYTRGTESVPEANYRDIFSTFLVDGVTQTSVVPDGTSSSAVKKVSDEVEHHIPRASTVLRKFHVFKNAATAELGFFWDEFVVAVTNDDTVL